MSEIENTIITNVSVKFSRRLDLGYPPYIKYLRELNGRPVPFGTRDNSNLEMDIYISASIGANDSADVVAQELIVKARQLLDANLGLQVSDVGVDPDAFVVDKTEITHSKVEF